MSKTQLGRLALRVEGDWWVAYFAEPTHMTGAINLGQIRMRIAHIPACKAAFMTLMQAAVADMLSNHGAITWPTPPTPAPESEKAGRA